MKNFKLLLATTAILSTALAMNVKADEPSTTTLNVHLGIVVPDEIYSIQDIDFGSIRFSTSDLENDFSITMNPATGVATLAGDGRRQLGKSKNGQVSVTMKDDAPKKIAVYSPTLRDYEENYALALNPTFVEIDSFSRAGYTKKTYGIGGSISGTAGQYGPGEYNGEITVTVIEDTGE